MFVFAQMEALFRPNLLKRKMFMVLSLVSFYTYQPRPQGFSSKNQQFAFVILAFLQTTIE